MLCRSCRRQVARGALFCGRCGAPQARGVRAPLDLLIGETRVPLTQTITLGRAETNDVTLADPTVSRVHARVLVTASDTSIEDAGSSHGTLLDDRPLRGRAQLSEGSVVRLGDTVLRVERHPDELDAGRTVMLDAVGVELTAAGAVRDRVPHVSSRPRLTPGCALKQLEEDEGDQRWVLRDEAGAKYLRMGDAEASLVQVLAADASLEDLLAASERDQGAAGPPRLARLLADLGEHGLLEQTGDGYDPFEHDPGLLERMFKPREWAFSNPDGVFQAAYRYGGWLLFSAPGLAVLGAIAAVGFVAFLRLALFEHVTPFVVADHLGWGAAVFLAGRLAAVSLHEIGHGLAVASFGRRVRRAGVKLILIFPFGFVDTSDAWFEPRRRRIAVSAAGPGHRPDRRGRGGDRDDARPRHRRRHRLPDRARRLHRRPLQPEPAARPRRLSHPGRPAAPARPAGALAAAAAAAPGRPAGAARPLAVGRPVCRRGPRLVAGLRLLCHT